MERFLIVRLGAMGDVIHALPAVAALRAAQPSAHIGWVIEKRWRELLTARQYASTEPGADQPLVNTLHLVDTKRWRKALGASSTRAEVREVLAELRAQRYEVALDFQGSLKSAVIARLGGARVRVGSRDPREAWARFFYTRTVQLQRPHVVEQALEIASHMLGTALSDQPAELPVDLRAEGWVRAELERRGLTRFAIVNPGAGWGAKQWPAERYGAVAADLSRLGIRTLVNAGPGEHELAARVTAASNSAAEAITCTISQLIALTRRASLFIGGDTGPMHLAAALRVPVVALFGPTDPARNGPYGTRSVVLRNPASRTSYSHADTSDAGLESISADDAIAAAYDLLGASRA